MGENHVGWALAQQHATFLLGQGPTYFKFAHTGVASTLNLMAV